jgi:hypothetical protein
MSWSIVIPSGTGAMSGREAIPRVEAAPSEPAGIEQMANPDEVRRQVRMAKKMAIQAVSHSDYFGGIRVYLNGHANPDAKGDSVSVTISRL